MPQQPDAPALPPGPWTWQTTAPPDRPDGSGHVYLRDSTGRRIASIWGRPAEKVAIAEMITEARNGDLLIQGIALAAASLICQHDQPVMARDILDGVGLNLDDLICAGVSEIDLARLRPLFPRND